jgi:hypothetical protein
MSPATLPPLSSFWTGIRTYSTLSILHSRGLRLGCRCCWLGSGFQDGPQTTPRLSDYNEVGNGVLYDSGHYLRNLALARLGVLPFYICCAALVFVWTRRKYGDVAALASIFLFSTLPTVLAFAGLAYSDMAGACTQSGAVFALMLWLDQPSWRRTLLLGAGIGLALAAKLTSLIFVLVSGVAILALRWLVRKKQVWQLSPFRTAARFSVALLLAGAVVWSTYGFEFGRVRESMGLTPSTMPSFQHFPAIVGRVARDCVLADCRIPAPSCYTELPRPGSSIRVRLLRTCLGKSEMADGGISFLQRWCLRRQFHFLSFS